MSLFQSKEGRALQLLASLIEEVRGLRVAVELLALKQGAVPIPDQPDEADFLAQTDEDFALLQALQKQSGASDEVDLLEDQARQEAGPAAPPPTKVPVGSFLPRFQR